MHGKAWNRGYCIPLSCLLSFLCNPYIPFLIYENFHLLVDSDLEMPYFLSFSHYASSAWCIMRYTACPCLVSCPFYAIPIIIPFLIYIIRHFHILWHNCNCNFIYLLLLYVYYAEQYTRAPFPVIFKSHTRQSPCSV